MNSMRGYIALLSVLMVSGVLLVTTTAAGIMVYFAAQDVRGEMAYRRSRAAALSCAQLVVHALSVDRYRFASDTPASFPVTASSTCVVESVQVTQQEAEALLVGMSEDAVSLIRMQASRPAGDISFKITSFEE
jgi:hypothetical protein